MISSEYSKKMQILASAYANRPDIVQGAGGNFSVKTDGVVMLIKASGKEFKDITIEGDGVVPVFYTTLKNLITDGSLVAASEAERLAAVRSSTGEVAENVRPSMETWFHTLLPAYVLHTHSVYVNILSCAEGGSETFKTLMEERGFSTLTLPYYNPGFELGDALHRALNTLTKIPPVIFLENHGIIVAAESPEECLRLHEEVERSIKNALHISDSDFTVGELSAQESEDFDALILFPDQVVYPQHPAIRAAHRFIMKHMRQNRLTARIIPPEAANTLLTMDSEKHRKNLKKVS